MNNTVFWVVIIGFMAAAGMGVLKCHNDCQDSRCPEGMRPTMTERYVCICVVPAGRK